MEARVMKRLLVAAAAAALLSACATATPYQPYQKNVGGFTEQQIESNRVRLTFKGNSLTNRETVETYLLYRAAEVTLANGYDYFTIADRATDAKTRIIGDAWGDPYFDYFPLRYRYYNPHWGWYDPFYSPRERIDVSTSTQYEATAEILMAKGEKPADKPEAFDAKDVVKNLGGKVTRPQP
jgi:hypothetical protein